VNGAAAGVLFFLFLSAFGFFFSRLLLNCPFAISSSLRWVFLGVRHSVCRMQFGRCSCFLPANSISPGLSGLLYDRDAALRYHNVFCFSPHSLHVYCTRTSPEAAQTRFGAPHFPHLASIRVSPRLTVTPLRSKASFTKRSVSSRSSCFDISRFLSLGRTVLHAIADLGNEAPAAHIVSGTNFPHRR
jgi:hypothetical protein